MHQIPETVWQKPLPQPLTSNPTQGPNNNQLELTRFVDDVLKLLCYPLP